MPIAVEDPGGKRSLTRWPWITGLLGAALALNPWGMAIISAAVEQSPTDWLAYFWAYVVEGVVAVLVALAAVEWWVRGNLNGQRRQGGPEAMIRPARKSDASEMVALIDSAGYGLPLRVWSGMRKDEPSVLEVGRQRAMREDGGFSYRNAFMAEANGIVQGMLIGYRLDDPHDVGDLDAVPEMFRSAVELEALAPGSWYVNVVAVHGEYRGKGLGGQLLAHAEKVARASGARQMSIIFESGNEGGARLYRRFGYVEKARRPRVSFPGDYTGSSEWLLYAKDLAEATSG